MHPDEAQNAHEGMAAEQELPILDRLARLEARQEEERTLRFQFEEQTNNRLSRIERAIGLDDRPHLVRSGR